MPKWPAWIMVGLMVVSAYPALTASAPAPDRAADRAEPGSTAPSLNEAYDARGAEPGWIVRIGGGRIQYAGDYSDQRIDVERPEPSLRADGRHYSAGTMAIDVAYERCNDALSGAGFEHRVVVTVGQQVMRGCGGARRPEWDI